MNSLYEKTCPRCAADHAVQTTICACGYRFDASESADEERLFAEYLAARAKQTAEAAIVAEARRKAAPHDPRTAADAIAAIREAEEARRMLTEQLDRINAVAPPVVAPAAAKSSIPPSSARSPGKLIATPPANSAAAGGRTPPAASATPTARATSATTPPSISSHVSAMPSAKGPVPRVVPAPRLLSASASLPVQSCPVCGATVAGERTVCGCGYSLAPPDLPSLGAPLPASAGAATRKAISTAEALATSGRARLARDAERVAQRLTLKDKTCPHCTAQIASDAKECGCGFVFIEPTHLMPSLGLDPGDQGVLDSLAKKPK